MAGVLAAARLRYPSPSTCGAAGRHTDRPDGIVGDDTPWARSFAPFARPKGLCAPMRGAPLKRWLLFPCAAAQPVFDGHRRESRFAAKY